MTKKTETPEQSPQKTKSSKKNIIKWILVGLVILISFVGFEMWNLQKNADARRDLATKQREILVENWKEEGLSDDEIQEKLKDQAFSTFDQSEITLFQRLYMTVRHATGSSTGTGDGPRNGTGMGQGISGGSN